MNPDLVIITIAAAAGFFAGVLVWMFVCGLFMEQVRRRTEKETWAAANRYYIRKAGEL